MRYLKNVYGMMHTIKERMFEKKMDNYVYLCYTKK